MSANFSSTQGGGTSLAMFFLLSCGVYVYQLIKRKHARAQIGSPTDGALEDLANVSTGSLGLTRGEDIFHTIKVSLEDLYNGKTVNLPITRKKPCSDCEGRGGKEGAERQCDDCQGRGKRFQWWQMQSVCPACRGQGRVMEEKDKCKPCRGEKVVKARKVLEVNIEKGMNNGHKIKFSGESDEMPGTVAGDVVIVVQEKEHDVFQRQGSDLFMSIELTLKESICGFVKEITHLDGRTLKIEVPRDQVTPHNAVKMIQGEGMPHHDNPFTKGRLFLRFQVSKTLPVATAQTINSALPKRSVPMHLGKEKECEMADADISQFGC